MCIDGGRGWDGCDGDPSVAAAHLEIVRSAVAEDAERPLGIRGALSRDNTAASLARAGVSVVGGVPKLTAVERMGLNAPQPERAPITAGLRLVPSLPVASESSVVRQLPSASPVDTWLGLCAGVKHG